MTDQNNNTTKPPSDHKKFHHWFSGAPGFSTDVWCRRNVVHPSNNRLALSWLGKNFCFRVRLFRDQTMNDNITDILRFLEGVRLDLKKLQELIAQYQNRLVDVNAKSIKALFVETDEERLDELNNKASIEVLEKQIENPV